VAPSPTPTPVADPLPAPAEVPDVVSRPAKRRRREDDAGRPGRPAPPASDEKKRLWDIYERYHELFPDLGCKEDGASIDDFSEDDIQGRINAAQKAVNRTQDTRMLGEGLVLGCRLIEKTVPRITTRVRLEGYGDEVKARLREFDTVLKQLAIKYSLAGAFPPEVLLLSGLARIAAEVDDANCRRAAAAEAPAV
jgi:hypothetical protein